MASSSGSTQNIYDGNPQQRRNENNENTGNKPSNTIVKDEPGDNTQKIAANKTDTSQTGLKNVDVARNETIPESSREMTEEDLDVLINAMENMKKSDDGTLEDFSNHPAFMTEFDPTKPMSAEMEGLMRLKYESEDPIAQAEAYKEDGNHEFQKKQYRIAIDNYTEGIKGRCSDRLLNAVLYTNRAAAQFHLGNHRSALNDCIFACKFKPDHIKALHRGALCCLEMKKYEDCVHWCDRALAIDAKNSKILDVRQKATKLQKAVEKDKRKEQLQDKKALTADEKLLEAIQKRGIKLAGMKTDENGKLHPGLLSSIETHNPRGVKVTMDTNGILYWPVMFLYPEHTETDFIQTFCENHRLIDHLMHMFGAESDLPPWDKKQRYKPHTINIYFEDKEKEKLIKINKESTLLKVLKHERFVIHGGMPAFILTVAGSKFEQTFLTKYQ